MFPEAGLLWAKGTVGDCFESVEDSVEDLVSFSWPASVSARGLGGDFTGPSGVETCLLWRPALFLLLRPGLAR